MSKNKKLEEKNEVYEDIESFAKDLGCTIEETKRKFILEGTFSSFVKGFIGTKYIKLNQQKMYKIVTHPWGDNEAEIYHFISYLDSNELLERFKRYKDEEELEGMEIEEESLEKWLSDETLAWIEIYKDDEMEEYCGSVGRYMKGFYLENHHNKSWIAEFVGWEYEMYRAQEIAKGHQTDDDDLPF